MTAMSYFLLLSLVSNNNIWNIFDNLNSLQKEELWLIRFQLTLV